MSISTDTSTTSHKKNKEKKRRERANGMAELGVRGMRIDKVEQLSPGFQKHGKAIMGALSRVYSFSMPSMYAGTLPLGILSAINNFSTKCTQVSQFSMLDPFQKHESNTHTAPIFYTLALLGAKVLLKFFFSSVSSMIGSTPLFLILSRYSVPYR